MAIRLMIADDHVAVRAGVASLIRGTDIELVCQAETCEETVKFAVACQPDVLLLDVRLAGHDGLSSLEEIRAENPDIRVLIFSVSDEIKDMAFARKMGANGYLLKGASRDELLNTIRRVAAGRNAWTTRQIRQVVSRAAATALLNGDRNPLSSRELEVLDQILLGRSNEGISEELEIDVETVKQHVKHILRKLHVVDRTQAALLQLRSSFAAERPPSEFVR